MSYTVLYDGTKLESFELNILPLLEGKEVVSIALDLGALPELAADAKVLLWLSDADLYQVLPHAVKAQWQVGFLPHPEMIRLYRTFDIAKKPKEALQDIDSVESPVMADLMTCNGDLVFGSVMLGNPSTMRPASQMDDSFLSKIVHLISFMRNLRHDCLFPYKLTTAKNTTISTAALGITVVYRASGSDFTRRTVGETEVDESTLNALILAPRSLSQMLHFLATKLFSKKSQQGLLPDYLGHLKTESLVIKGTKELAYSIDGQQMMAESVSLAIQKDALKVLSRRLPEKENAVELKESMRISGLPKGQSINDLISRPLPWIYHSDPEEVKETFVTLKENARTSESYLVLMVLATLLATVGLFANSAPVIIGAMILAPLMAPIISLAMGMLRQNTDLITVSAKTLFTGIILALSCGTLLTLMTPLQSINSEIGARLSPTLLDLGVAIISGVAGAYANARSDVAKSLAGVAIAVALVPPLAVSGIGIGWLDWHVFWGAFLLFMTNLVGIVLAAAATFLVMGFSPFHLAKKGILLSLVFVGIVSVPLILAFDSMVTEQRVVNALEGSQIMGIEISDVRVLRGSPMTVAVKLLAHNEITEQQLDSVKLRIEQEVGETVRLEAITARIR
ncbi:MAG: TIGR00341 family protein [Thiotrichales bacterium]|nr:TIGR00341 family protein [Thiotrichales bacterium]